jgi:hypothetical protein
MGSLKQKSGQDSTWGSNNTTFNSSTPKKEEIKTNDSIKHSPEIHKEHEILFDNPWLKVKKAGGFIYSERKGVDSIAFILIAINANDERRIGLINEYKDPIKRFATTAFGGSIDDIKYHDDLRLLVKDEAMEESGFNVENKDIYYYGKVIVSTQSNQFCHLFAIEVDKLSQTERTTENPTELLSDVKWISIKEAQHLEDWKAQAIILRRMMSKNGLIYVNTKQ